MERLQVRVWVLAAAVGGVVLGAGGVARGQYPVENGRANDANNQIGSGGYNSGSIPAPETLGGGNNIVTGNVTGAKAFRGPVGYRAPGTFSGNSATYDYEQRTRDFSAAPVGYGQQQQATNYSNTPVPFYTTVGTPPAGFVSTPGNSGLVPGPQRITTGDRFDDRLGVITNAPADGTLPQPGQLLIPGPVDASGNRPFYAATPLTGLREFNTADPAAAAILGQAMNARALSDDQILRMRRELTTTMATPDLPDTRGGLAPATGTPTPGTPQPLDQQRPQQGGNAPGTPQSLSPQPLDSALGSTANNFSTGARQGYVLSTPAQQSSQYAEMQRRLMDRQQQMTDEERNREFLRQQQQQGKSGTGLTSGSRSAAAPGGQQPKDQRPIAEQLGVAKPKEAPKKSESRSDRPYVANQSGGVTANIPTSPRPAAAEPPIEVKSLATGVKAEGLRTLLQQAESNMKDGKFDTAIGVYESAAQVAPNNPMILLGQANAELGGEYFARADNHLRQAFLLDPALLMARYDLRSMVGDKRLNDVIESLRKIAATETKETRAPFLLAYVAYNSGDADRAASYLELAEKRAGGPDPVFRILRSHWNLPATTTDGK